MRKMLWHLSFSGLLAVTVLLGLLQVTRGQGVADEGARPANVVERQGESRREKQVLPGAGEASDISFIDSPTVACYQPDAAQDACYINWYYMSVNASPNYMIAMTATLNAIGHVARYGGFFQTSMYVPYNMHGQGFKVACGPAGAGGVPNLGHAYAWTIRARDSVNLGSANYGTVYCPAFTP